MVAEINERQEGDRDLIITLAQWMAGDFSNQKQAFADPTNYAHIHVFFRPLPYKFFNAIGLYSEQVYDYDLWNPYRQGVHRLIARGERVYIENYGFKDGLLYAGAGRDRSILASIVPEAIERRFNCSMIFQKVGDRFLGNVEPGNKCLIERQGCQTYLVSEVELTESTWVSLDRGMDVNTHEQVWGSQTGALKFEKVQSFADEVPTLLVD